MGAVLPPLILFKGGVSMAYIRPKRTDTGKLDGLLYKAEMLHDDLHEAYADGKVFRCAGKSVDFGKLKSDNPKNARHIFNLLHGLIGRVFEVSVIENNNIPEGEKAELKAKHDEPTEGTTSTFFQAEKKAISLLKIAGYELVM